MPTGADVVLAALDLGHVIGRAVRTRVADELRERLAAGGTAVGDEIIEVQCGDAPSGRPVLSERLTMIIIDDSLALVFGLLPDSAVSAEAVSPDGERVSCTIAPGTKIGSAPYLYTAHTRTDLGLTTAPGGTAALIDAQRRRTTRVLGFRPCLSGVLLEEVSETRRPSPVMNKAGFSRSIGFCRWGDRTSGG